MKMANSSMKFYKLFFENKIHFGQFDLFRSFSTVWLGMGEIEIGHCYYWILKQSGHDFCHDYYWILKQSGNDRILKQWGHDFSGKHLCVGYCMDIMWYLMNYLIFVDEVKCFSQDDALLILILGFIFDHTFDPKSFSRISFPQRYAQCYLWYFAICAEWRLNIVNISRYNSIPVLKNGIRNTVFYTLLIAGS